MPRPRILIIDDLFGRTHEGHRNEERASLCGQYLLVDVTGDEVGKAEPQNIIDPASEVVFFRGQSPACSKVGDRVQNDLEGIRQTVRTGWDPDVEGPRWAMVLIDLCFYTGQVTSDSNLAAEGMPEGREGDDDPENYFGIKVLQVLHEEFPDLPVVVLSSKPRDEVSQSFAYFGALGFLPRDDSRSPEILREYLWKHGLVQDPTGEVVGKSKSLLLALRAARRAGASSGSILIRGERGTGKELMARYIHRQRRNASSSPFVVVNSAVLTAELFASELFGIERGIATGVEQRTGLVKTANGGDLFFDEISDMVPQAQAGILRVLEEKQVKAVGARSGEPVDVRFLSATNAAIERIATGERFRSDLFDRLREGGMIMLPPLRERREDIPLLVEHFLREAEQANPAALTRTVNPETIELLQAHEWPGNVRELRNCIVNAVNSHPDVEHLVPFHIEMQLRKPVGDMSGICRDAGTAMAMCMKAALVSAEIAPASLKPGQLLGIMRDLMRNTDLTRAEAGEIVLSMFRLSPDLLDVVDTDPYLARVYEVAQGMLQNRPRRVPIAIPA